MSAVYNTSYISTARLRQIALLIMCACSRVVVVGLYLWLHLATFYCAMSMNTHHGRSRSIVDTFREH